MWCAKRITNQDLLLRFKDGKHRFYLESVCGQPIDEGQHMCYHCKSLRTQLKTQDVKTFPHGLVMEEYPPESHIYDSPWYHAKVKAYGAPSDSELELAMDAQSKARQGKRVKSIKELSSSKANLDAANPVAESPSAKTIPAAITPTQTPKTTTTAKKTKPRVKKEKEVVKTNNTSDSESLLPPQTVAQQLTEAIISKLMKEHTMAETMDDALPVQNVIRVVLRPFSHNNIQYWRDADRERIYRKNKDGKKGEYVGRWNADKQQIQCESSESDEDTCV
jgi:hypothetical protein